MLDLIFIHSDVLVNTEECDTIAVIVFVAAFFIFFFFFGRDGG